MSSVCSDPEISNQYNNVRDDAHKTNWVYVSYLPNSDSLAVRATGEDGFNGLMAQLDPKEAGFAYCRFEIGNDKMSIRSKFVLLIWAGEEAPLLRRAKINAHLNDVKRVMPIASFEYHARSKAELKYEEIEVKLRKAMGANYDRQESSY